MQTKNLKFLPLISIPFLLLFIWSAYSNIFYSPPTLDDFSSFIHDPLLRISEWNTRTLLSLGETRFGWTRWLPLLTLSWDMWLGEGSLFHLHFTNLIIHSLCFLSVLFLILKISNAAIQRVNESNPSGSAYWVLPLWVAGLWALHPLQTNAVTYIVQRMASLVALFSILSVAFYLSSRLAYRQAGRITFGSIITSVACAISILLALLCKENAAIIPLLIILSEIWFFRPQVFSTILQWISKHPIHTSILFILCCVIFTYWISTKIIPSYFGRHFTLTERLLSQPRVIVWYISILLWPYPSRLSLEYDVELSTSLIQPWTTLPSIALLLWLLFWSFSQRQTKPLISFGVMWFFLTMIIESSIIPLELAFEHRMYLPSVGLVLSISVFVLNGLDRLSRRQWRIEPTHSRADFLVWCCLAILGSILTLATFQRNTVWEDFVTLQRDNVAKAPLNPRAHANLGVSLLRAGTFDEAIEESRKAIELGRRNYEDYSVAANTIVLSYIGMGDQLQAIMEGERFISQKPEGINEAALPDVYLGVALAKEKVGDVKGAFEYAFTAFSISQRLPSHLAAVKENSLRLAEHLLLRAKEEKLDLDQDGAPDPGNLSETTWIAQKLLLNSDRSGALQEVLKDAKLTF